jgi:hypothetical protein
MMVHLVLAKTQLSNIEFGLAEGKKLIDSGQLSRPTN